MENEIKNSENKKGLTPEQFKDQWEQAMGLNGNKKSNINIVVDYNGTEVVAEEYVIHKVNEEYIVYLYFLNYIVGNMYLKNVNYIY